MPSDYTRLETSKIFRSRAGNLDTFPEWFSANIRPLSNPPVELCQIIAVCEGIHVVLGNALWRLTLATPGDCALAVRHWKQRRGLTVTVVLDVVGTSVARSIVNTELTSSTCTAKVVL
jgi:hypothetical protein